MMRLPALDPRERACLQALQPGTPLRAFAHRLQQRLIASLAVPVDVREIPCEPAGKPAGDEPVIIIEPQIAAAWLALRLGGKPAASDGPIRDEALVAPFKRLVRRTLAESALNAGEAVWPQAMRLRIGMGGRQGPIDISWSGAQVADWARRVIREKA